MESRAASNNQSFPGLQSLKMEMLWKFLLLFQLLTLSTFAASSETLPSKVHVQIDVNDHINLVEHFWKSTGFSPSAPHSKAAELLLSDDMKKNIALIGALPHTGLEQVRIHWLLELVQAELSDNTIKYNFTILNKFIHLLLKNNLRPGFELMGNPSEIFTSFKDTKQVYEFRNLIQSLAQNFMNLYRESEVSRWNFESWNEPDHQDFDKLAPVTTTGYLNYYDACSEGLRNVSTLLKFGGPGGSCRPTNFSVLCQALLDHCDNGTNFFTNETGVRLDFISFHKKAENIDPSSILEMELETIKRIHREHPKFANVSVYNDEADMEKGWNKLLWWRRDTTYAALVTAGILRHQNKKLSPKYGNVFKYYKLLSNDNAFLNYYPNFFSQRTLLARFQMNNTKPAYSDFVKKPVYTAMGLLSLLANQQVHAKIWQPNLTKNSSFDVLATCQEPKKGKDGKECAAIFCASGSQANSSENVDVVLSVKNIFRRINEGRKKRNRGKKARKFENFDKDRNGSHCSRMWVYYELNNMTTNPYKVWSDAGRPVFPSKSLFSSMRKSEGPIRPYPPQCFQYNYTHEFAIATPAIVVFQFCKRPEMPPGGVHNIQALNISFGQVLLVWSDEFVKTKCIKTYDIEFSKSEHSSYKRIQRADSFFPSFVYSPKIVSWRKEATFGYYRVCAVDFWGRNGAFSQPIFYGHL